MCACATGDASCASAMASRDEENKNAFITSRMYKAPKCVERLSMAYVDAIRVSTANASRLFFDVRCGVGGAMALMAEVRDARL